MSDKVSFSQLVEELAKATGTSNKLSNDFAHKLIELVKENAIDEGKASITNFGSFAVVDVSERQGVNPQTGETIIIPAHQRLSFTPFKALENEVNKPFAHLESTVVGESDEKAAPSGPASPKPASTAPAPPPAPEPVMETSEEESEEEEESVSPVARQKTSYAPRTYNRPGQRSNSSSGASTLIILIVVTAIIAALVWWFARPGEVDAPIAEDTSTQVTPPAEESTQQADAEPAAQATPQPGIQSEPVEPEVIEEMDEPVRATATPAQSPPPVMEESTASSAEIPSTYRVEADEWFYDIARKVYGVPTLWPLIYEANYSTDQNPDIIEPGPVLTIPGLDGSPDNLTAADEANLQKAVLAVAESYQKAGMNEKAQEFTRWAKLYND